MRRPLATTLVAAFAIAACSGGAVPTSTVPVPPSSQHPPTAIPTTPAPATATPVISTPSVVPTATPAKAASGAILLAPGCEQGVTRCEDMAPGTYETSGTWAFLRGLTVTLPAGWSSSEQDAGEFNLHLATDPAPASAIFFWKDLVPWVDGAPRPELGTSADKFADFFLGDSRFTVVEGPSRTFKVRGPDSLAATSSVQARSLTVIVSASAKSDADVSADCTEVCVNVLTDPVHWGGEPVNLGRNIDAPVAGCPCSHAWHLYIASIGRELHPHIFVVVEETVGPDPMQALSAWEPQAEPIIDSVLVPYIVVDN